ncbi:hypothetical protein [Thalassobellus suaedae]|uniref:Uncharacterized protein n=1 Tax=Thalassobellus suaedae TaxID=3074124 RepID=A0ABY9XVQ4_9FLAO|nr:hypothetical protein RHP51_04675 [Flavobacteriaceae bacterium HL-DH14]
MSKIYSKYQEKTKNQIRLSFKKTLTYIICIIGAVLIFIAPLVHIKFSKTNPVVESYKQELHDNIASIDNDLKALRLQYYSGNQEYFTQYDNLISKRNATEIANDKLINLKIDENRIFGWKTLRSFLIGFGVRLPYLLIAFLVSYLITKQKTEDIYLKHCYNLLQVSLYGISLYLIIWCFWPHQDYNITTYLFAVLALCILVSAMGVCFITYREIFKLRLQKMVDAFSLFIVKDAKKHIKKGGEKEYIKSYLKAFKKGIE